MCGIFLQCLDNTIIVAFGSVQPVRIEYAGAIV